MLSYYIRSYPHSLTHHCVSIICGFLSCKDHRRYRPQPLPYPLQIRYFSDIILSYWVVAVVLSNDYYTLPRGPAHYGPRQEYLVMRKREHLPTYIFPRGPLSVAPTGIKTTTTPTTSTRVHLYSLTSNPSYIFCICIILQGVIEKL